MKDKKEKMIECDFCGKENDDKITLKDKTLEKKDGSEIRICGDCLNNYASGNYDKIKFKGEKIK